MRITLLAVSTIIIPAVLAAQPQQEGTNALDQIKNVVMLKRSKVHRVHGDKVESIIAQAVEASESSFAEESLASSVNAVTAIAKAAAASASVFPVVIANEINDNAVSSVAASASLSAAPIAKQGANNHLQEKVEISNDDFYFSQTDSYSIPSVSSFPPGSPFVKPFSDLPMLNHPLAFD